MMNVLRVLTCAIVGYVAGGIAAQVSWAVFIWIGNLTASVLVPSSTLEERGVSGAGLALLAATSAFYGVYAAVAYRIWRWRGWQPAAAATSATLNSRGDR